MGQLIRIFRGSSVVRSPLPANTKPTNKILLALQFWKGDQAQAMRLARFIADLSPEFCEQADFLFSARFDCPQDPETVKYVSRKFNVWTYQCRRRGVGWPQGCNELWFGTMSWIQGSIEALKLPHYRAVLTFESDCVPMQRNWITQLRGDWDKAQAKKPAYVMGAMLRSPGEHINGNAMFSTELNFLRWLAKDVVSASSFVGWDYCLAQEFKKWGWAESKGMHSYWNSKTLPPDAIANLWRENLFFMHGIKDDSLLNSAKEKFHI
jgi:hypothetical protein